MTAAIGMADSTGHVFADTLPIPAGVSIADRPHFRAQIDPAHDDLFISRPVHGRVSGEDTIQFTRKLLGPHGEFAGVTVFSLGCDELSQLLSDARSGQRLRVAAVGGRHDTGARPADAGLDRPHDHGNRQARQHADQQTAARSASTASGAKSSTIASFRHLQDYPLIVMVGLDTGTVFHQYRVAAPARDRQRHRRHAGDQPDRRAVAAAEAAQRRVAPRADHHAGDDQPGHPDGRWAWQRSGGQSAGAGPAGRAGRDRRTRHADDAAVPRRRTGRKRRGQPDKPAIPFGAGRSVAQPGQDTRFETARDDGAIIEVRSHALADGGFVHTYTDVTEQRLADARVRYLAHHDTLTGLANRVQLRQRIPEFLDSNVRAADC